ncbi:MAG: hypothetical protein AAF253_11695 [Pseudomonadota bacterium]
MFNDPIFDRYKEAVWPLFRPVFVLAIVLFRRQAAALFAGGCLDIAYEVGPFGTLRIIETVYPRARPDWKDALFFVTGAYAGELSGAAPAREHAPCPALVRELHILALNWIILPRSRRAGHTAPRRHSRASLPLPDP